MSNKLIIEELISNVKNNKNIENIIIIPKEISRNILIQMLNINNTRNVKIYYKDEYVFKLKNEDKNKFIKNDFIFLRSSLENTNSIFDKYNLIHEIENINDLLNIFFLENNIFLNNSSYSANDILNKYNYDLLSLESKIFIEILKIWIEKSSETSSTFINKYVEFLNSVNEKSSLKCLHLIDYESFYNLEKNFFTNLSDISYVYNCHDNIDYELKPNNINASNYESYDFDSEEEELNFIANDIEKFYKKNNNSIIALINNDRYFSRRLRALLDRKNIKINDNSGWLLSTSSCCAYINTVLNYFINNNNYVNLHDILISPFFSPEINIKTKSEFLRLIQITIKNDLDCEIDKNILNINNKNPEIIKLNNKFIETLNPECNCTVDYFYEYIIKKLEEFNSIEILTEDEAGKEFFIILDNMRDLYKSIDKQYKIYEWQEILRNLLENKTFTENNNSNIYLLNIKNTSIYRFDKIYISSMSSKNYPKIIINNFSKNNLISSELTLNSNIENQESIKDFLQLKNSSKNIFLSYHKSNLEEIFTKSKFKMYLDHFLNINNNNNTLDNNYINKDKKNNNEIELPLNDKFKTLTYRDIENFNSCFYCFFNNINSPRFSQSIISRNNFTFGRFVHEIISCMIKDKVNLHDFDSIKNSLIEHTNLKTKLFYNKNYIPYEVILWKKLISKIANYFYHDNDKKYNFLSERKLQYVYKNNITLKGRYDLKYSINNNHYLVDFKTGYTDSRSNVLTGVSLQLPFYSILDNNINFFEYLSLNVSKNSIKSTLFEKDDFYDSTKLIFNTLDAINSLIINKKKLLVRKSSSGCEICGHEDLNRL